LGQNGTYFDYVKDGGHDALFPVARGWLCEKLAQLFNSFDCICLPFLKPGKRELLTCHFPDNKENKLCQFHLPDRRGRFKLIEVLPFNLSK
jgi:hypothetical protein